MHTFSPGGADRYNSAMKSYFQRINTQTKGNRNDVTPIFADPQSFKQLIHDLAQPFTETPIDYVAAIDALGFILGTSLAQHFNRGLITIRKGGKLPVDVDRIEFTDYSGKSKQLEISTTALKPGDRILLVDEWIETAAQIQAAIQLIENQNATIVAIATINMDTNDATIQINEKYQVHSIWNAP